MGRLFEPSRKSTGVEAIRTYPALAGQVIVLGSLVLLDANGLLTLGGADPASILGVALNPQGRTPGFDVGHSPVLINGLPQADLVSVALASTTEFMGQMTNAGAIVTPTQAMVADAFGVVNTAGVWTIDQTETVNTRLTITDVDIDNRWLFFRFLAANIQAA